MRRIALFTIASPALLLVAGRLTPVTLSVRIVGLAVLASALLIGGVQPDAALACGGQPDPAMRRDIFLIGHPIVVAEARQLLRELGISTRTDLPLTEDERVFFVIDARDGPQPPTREALRDLPITSFRWSAILIMNSRLVPDPELRQLAIQETREVLQARQVPRVEFIPVFLDDEEHFRFLVHGFRCIE